MFLNKRFVLRIWQIRHVSRGGPTLQDRTRAISPASIQNSAKFLRKQQVGGTPLTQSPTKKRGERGPLLRINLPLREGGREHPIRSKPHPVNCMYYLGPPPKILESRPKF